MSNLTQKQAFDALLKSFDQILADYVVVGSIASARQRVSAAVALYNTASTAADPLNTARAVASANAAERRAGTLFVLNWRSGLVENIYGWDVLAAQLGLAETSLHTLLSAGKGSFSLTRPNPETGNPDVVTVTRDRPDVVAATEADPRNLRNNQYEQEQ